MKTYLLGLLIIFLSLSSCSSDEEEKLEGLPVSAIDQSHIVGKWKLIEEKVSSGGEASWTSVSDGYTIEFLEDGTFEGGFADCNTGNYSLVYHPDDSDIKMLVLSFDCAINEDISQENVAYRAMDNINTDYIIYYPTYKSPRCTEGCIYKLKRQ
ncbi:hypothetical protein [Zunongwangia endophytica]|uniref:Lipocalin-like domain-containing protein n=1 Tax=Zunongwangia endophytica TaxID=1808945 RepID=A0ABV8HC46_9FLAO|nr:hypothetical protein [Zunongwangia endophytica]MDN3594743.1 hypothetical protein [Zunongwangia endophytica]